MGDEIRLCSLQMVGRCKSKMGGGWARRTRLWACKQPMAHSGRVSVIVCGSLHPPIIGLRNNPVK